MSRLTRVTGSPWLRVGLAVLVLACCGYGLYREWPAAMAGIGELRWYSALASLAPAMAGSACVMLAWRSVLADFGAPLPVRSAARISFIAQLAKYVPGAVVSLATQVELARDYGVPRPRSLAAVVTSATITVGTGLGVAAVTLPFTSPGVAGRYWWVLAAVPLIAAAACPPVLRRILVRALRRMSEPLECRPTWAGLGRAAGWSVAAWLLFGTQVWLLVGNVARLGGTSLLLAAGGYALAFCAGMVLVVSPSGLGARELILIATFAAVMPHGAALAIAIVSRLVTTGSDLIWATVAVTAGRPRRRRYACVGTSSSSYSYS